MKAQNELKPCPFCGRSDAITFNKDYLRNGHFGGFDTVIFSTIKGGCGASSGLYCSKQEALEAWNRRPEDDAD